jgi:UDP-N-acetylmuramoyl-tripeptide--D-alanyl-D-alanine ligase
MRATLAQLGQTPAKRRIAVLGAMKELGDFSPAFHAALAEPIAAAELDHVILVGDEMEALAGELGKAEGGTLGNGLTFAHCGNCDEAIAALSAYGLKDGDAVLVKGSNSVGLARLVARLSAEES